MRQPTLLNLSHKNCKKQLSCKQLAHGDLQQPTLIFLHGFLGSVKDWQNIANQFDNSISCYAVDLPGHGDSASVTLNAEQGFAHFNQLLIATLAAHQIQEYILVGYSLGGRLALYHASLQPKGLQGVILESCHYGLDNAIEKQQRWQHDNCWAKRFRTDPITEVLNDWYLQGVFSSLSQARKLQLIADKESVNVDAISHMLLATSLSNQQLLINAIEKVKIPVYYLYGNKDDKYQKIALQFKTKSPSLNIIKMNGAGHNIHFEQPFEYVRMIHNIYQNIVYQPTELI